MDSFVLIDGVGGSFMDRSDQRLPPALLVSWIREVSSWNFVNNKG